MEMHLVEIQLVNAKRLLSQVEEIFFQLACNWLADSQVLGSYEDRVK